MYFHYLLYNLILLALAPAWIPLAVYRGWRRGRSALGGGFSPRDAAELGGGRAIWLHAVSMGESVVGAALYKQLQPRLDATAWVLTTTTPTGYASFQRLLGGTAILRYFPLDLPWAMARSIRSVRPALLILVETELWPNLIYHAHRNGAKIVVVNGRISDRASRAYRHARWLLRPFLALVDRFFMQTALDAERIADLGARPERITVAGNIKFDLEPAEEPGPDQAELGLGRAPLLVAGSTHQGEEEILLDAFRRIRAAGPAGLILAPRHLERLPEIARLLTASGFTWGLRSASGSGKSVEILLVDTYGELMGFYRMAAAAYIGGSMVPIGGHNPIEAGCLGRPVLFGPHMENFRQAEELFLAAGAARRVRSAEEIAAAFLHLAGHPDEAGEMGRRAQAALAASRGATARIGACIAAMIEEAP